MLAIHVFGYMDLVVLMRDKAAATHVGKDVSNNSSWKRSLKSSDPPPVQIKSNFKVRWSYLGPCPVKFWKCPGVGILPYLWQLCPVYDHPHWERFSLFLINILCDTGYPLLPFVLSLCMSEKTLIQSSPKPSVSWRQLVEHPTWAFFSPGWTNQAPLRLFCHVTCSRLFTILGSSLLKLLEFVNPFWFINLICFHSSWVNSVPA